MESSFLCRACPRRCGAVRDAATGQGFCAMPALPRLARAAPHFGEEPCISGTRGSGAVFFSGCGLRYVFCQNHTISAGGEGETVTVARLREIFLRLRDQGVHNINLVTPSHYTFVLAQALSGLDLGIPVVYNSSGYDSVESLRALDGLVQVYMPDLKYMDSAVAARYSAAPDYPAVAQAADVPPAGGGMPGRRGNAPLRGADSASAFARTAGGRPGCDGLGWQYLS